MNEPFKIISTCIFCDKELQDEEDCPCPESTEWRNRLKGKTDDEVAELTREHLRPIVDACMARRRAKGLS